MELRKDLYIIPAEKGNIIYSPLRRGVFWANEQATEIVQRYLDGASLDDVRDSTVVKYIRTLSDAHISKPNRVSLPSGNRLVVILSQICNLACSYCYAQEARSKEILTRDKLKIAYDYILSDKNKYKHISFIGGGEPLVTWNIIEWSVDYINEHKSDEDKVSYAITTNATLLNEHIVRFCKENSIHIGVSFEIVKSIQDKQRPFYQSNESTFDVVHRNIQLLMENNISFGIRSTITRDNVSLMPYMTKFVVERYPMLKKVHFEQVTDQEQDNVAFYSEFIKYFFKARKIGKERGIEVYNSISNSIFRIRERFCNGETCITPTGSIVACHRLSSAKDKYYDIFCYGQIGYSGILINQERYQRYLDFAKEKMPECEGCYAYWHCAGICPMERTALAPEQLNAKCEFTKAIVKKILLEEIIGKK